LIERRIEASTDRRRVARGGRRASDRPGKHPPLLVAESYGGSRRVCVRYLDHFGFRVEGAGDGIEAMAKLEADLPQAILIEHLLPAMPALQMSRWLGERPHTQGIPLIVMTTDFDHGAGDAVANGGHVLVKPFSLSAMLDTVRQALRAHVTT
jgi:CheY-like chemotaxis protein